MDHAVRKGSKFQHRRLFAEYAAMITWGKPLAAVENGEWFSSWLFLGVEISWAKSPRRYRSAIFAANGEQQFGPVLSAIVDAVAPPLLIELSMACWWRAEDFLALRMLIPKDYA